VSSIYLEGVCLVLTTGGWWTSRYYIYLTYLIDCIRAYKCKGHLFVKLIRGVGERINSLVLEIFLCQIRTLTGTQFVFYE
jgi:hypothetical protein